LIGLINQAIISVYTSFSEGESMNKWQAFLSLNWYAGLISFFFRFIAMTSEPLLALGIIISAADFLLQGHLMAHNPMLVSAWAWCQAIAIEASTGPTLAFALAAFKARDQVKGILYAALAGLLFVVGAAMLFLQLASNVTGLSEASINPWVLYTLLVLRVLVASGMVALLCTKHTRFSGLLDEPLASPLQEVSVSELSQDTAPLQVPQIAKSRFESKEQAIWQALAQNPHASDQELAQLANTTVRTANKWATKIRSKAS
jgi:hypothetical protein